MECRISIKDCKKVAAFFSEVKGKNSANATTVNTQHLLLRRMLGRQALRLIGLGQARGKIAPWENIFRRLGPRERL